MSNLTIATPPPLRIFSREMILDIRAILADSYQKTHNECFAQYDPATARDLFPYQRKALIDTRLLSFAKKYGILFSLEKNISKNATHVEMKIGNTVVVVYYSPYGERRKNIYRDNLTQTNYIPLPGIGLEKLNTDKEYVEIIHGPSDSKLNELGFFIMTKPSCDDSGCIWRYDLNRLVIKNSVKPEMIEDEASVQLRRKQAMAKEQGDER